MSTSRGLRSIGWLVTAGSAVCAVLAVAVSVVGALALTGAVDHDDRFALLPGSALVVQPQTQWEVGLAAPICRRVDLSEEERARSCLSFVVQRDRAEAATGSVLLQDERTRPVRTELHGEVFFSIARGWNTLAAGSYLDRAVTWSGLAALLWLLRRLLLEASAGHPFTARTVSSLRWMGALLVAWQVWRLVWGWLFSPKALDYSATVVGVQPSIQFDAMDQLPSLGVLATGLLLLVLAEVFRHGAALADEQRLTV